MTQSQTIAKVFRVINYFLFIPTIPFTLLSLLALYFALIPIALTAIGITLWVGYGKHTRGELSEGKIIPLWVMTAVFNTLLLAPLVLSVQNESYYGINQMIQSGNAFALVYFSITIWQVLAILLSIYAIISQISLNRNIGRVP